MATRKVNELENKNRTFFFRQFIIFLTCGLSITIPPLFIPGDFETIYRIGIFILFLLVTIVIRQTHFEKYFPVISAFTIFSFVNFLDYFVYRNQSYFYWVSSSRMVLYVFFKLLTTALVVIPIILLNKTSGKELAAIFLSKGKLRLGLIIGIATFLVFLISSVQASILLYGGKNLAFGNLISWAPWVFTFVFANGFKEELQFRGLFLKKYETFLSPSLSNLLQAIIFTSAHLGETYSPIFLLFMVFVFFLGLAYGAIMQRTNSLLGSVLFHAGSDIPVILGIFSNL